jgi:hypothetical protein
MCQPNHLRPLLGFSYSSYQQSNWLSWALYSNHLTMSIAKLIANSTPEEMIWSLQGNLQVNSDAQSMSCNKFLRAAYKCNRHLTFLCFQIPVQLLQDLDWMTRLNLNCSTQLVIGLFRLRNMFTHFRHTSLLGNNNHLFH